MTPMSSCARGGGTTCAPHVSLTGAAGGLLGQALGKPFQQALPTVMENLAQLPLPAAARIREPAGLALKFYLQDALYYQ